MAVKNHLKIEKTASLYQYQSGNSVFHTMPSWIKLLVLFSFSIGLLYVPVFICPPLFIALLLCAKKSGIPFRFVWKDVTPVLYYAILLYFTSAISRKTFLPQPDDLIFCARIFIMLQIASLLFRTTSSLELKDGITTIELKIRKILHLQPKASAAQSFSFFLLFLPQTFAIWDSVCRAWKARGGKNNVQKVFILMPVLISLSIHKAWQTAKAVAARE